MSLESERRLLQGVHLLLALSLPVLLFLMTGCLKATAKKADVGPEVSVDQINDVLNRMRDGADLTNLSIGQYVDYSLTRRVEAEDIAMNLGGRRVEVIDKQDAGDQFHYTMRITDTIRQADNSFQTVVTEDALWLDKPATTSSIPRSLRAPRKSLLDVRKLVHASDDSGTDLNGPHDTFHNLVESDSNLDIPSVMSGRAGCGGLSSCTSIPAHLVQFDMLIWSNATDYQKISFNFAFSAASPFIPYGSGFQQDNGLILIECQSTYIPVQGVPIYVRDCQTFDDFQK